MAFTNSSLVTYTRISPNRNSPRNQPISKITIHHMAGVASLEQFGDNVARPSREMSANYAIDNNGRIGLFCEEKDRSWCSSSSWNDNRAVTIEVSNSKYGDAYGWPVSDAAYASLIKLCVDICKRNGIKKLEYTGTKEGSLTIHSMFAATACLPIDRTELLTPTGWKLLKDIKIGDKIASVHIDNLGVFFDDVENMVPVKTQDTYTIRDLEATSDHRIMYYSQSGRQYVSQFKDIYDMSCSIYIPNAGYCPNSQGIPLSNKEIELLIAVQADGHYMKDGNCYYGIEFHFKKDRKIKRVVKVLEDLGIEYKLKKKKDGSTSIRIYGKRYVKYCEEYLHDKCFTWDWLNMSNAQATFFLDTILEYDGCRANCSYSSHIKSNIDIVQAIASTHGVGSKLGDDDTRIYFKKDKRSLGDCKRKRNPRQQVSCVTVKSGFILIRQHGRTAIVGNCPGPYIKARLNDICNKVNAQLTTSETKPVTPKPTTSTSTKSSTKKGDLVTIAGNATYYTGSSIPSWVKQDKWYVSSISGDRAVLGLNEAKNRNIQSPINTKYLSVVKRTTTTKSYTTNLKSTDILYATPGGNTKGTVGTTGVFTIVEERTVNGCKYGKLKSGAGWVKLSVDKTIRKGSLVSLKSDAVYYNGSNIPAWVKSQKWYVSELSGDRAVLGQNEKRNQNIQSPINTKYLY